MQEGSNGVQSRDYVGSDLEALADLRHYQQWIFEDYRPHLKGRVLEVGAGIGNVARQYAPTAREVVLLEPAQNLIPILRERAASLPNTRVVEGDVESLADAEGTFDAILMINVLEHILDDFGTLKRLHNLLRPGGALLVFVPACSWLYGSLDELVRHERRYEWGRLRSVIQNAGFEIGLMKHFDVAGIAPWWFTGKVLKQRSFNPAIAKVYDRVVVPLMSRVERFVPPPIGKNLSCVAFRGAPAVGQQIMRQLNGNTRIAGVSS